MKLLFVAPHPDDCEIACGGAISRFVREGDTVDLVVFVGEGDLHMVHSDETIPFTQRMEEQRKAADILGISKIHWLGVGPASKLDTIPLGVGVGRMDKLLSENDYAVMYIPLPSHNQDHNYCWEVCLAATRPSKNDQMGIFAYEQATQFHGVQSNGPIPNRYYVTYDECDQDNKERAIACHVSQMNSRSNSLVGVAGARKLSELRGMEVGAEYAEIYSMLRYVV